MTPPEGQRTIVMGVSLPLLDAKRPADSPKPPWLKVRAPGGPKYIRLKGLMREWNLHSVCEEAHCPNIGECWEDLTATFMILGDVCTRNCGYCAVAHGRPVWEDREEPERVGRAVGELGLEHVVITSVNRDDLADGGAAHFAATTKAIRRYAPGCRVELLIPDFQGNGGALETVIAARPDVLNHNTETVPRLYKVARHGGRYERTLELFRRARRSAPGLVTKSGIILGLGEERDELLATMADLRAADVHILTLGQYLRPSAQHLPVSRFYHPDEFAELAVRGKEMGFAELAVRGKEMGFAHVESGPLVRSSYHAKRQTDLAGSNGAVAGRGAAEGEPAVAGRGAAEGEPSG
jgi:lipoic acid synthetase